MITFTRCGSVGATAIPPVARNSSASKLMPSTSRIVATPRMIVVPAVLCTKYTIAPWPTL
jgi:hypothetical protein